MKDMGEAAYILGIRIYRDRLHKLIGLCQDTFIDKVLHRFSMHDSKKGFLPMSHGISLSKTQCPSTHDERERMSRIPYASAIGSIMYAMLCTRPDIACALSMTSRYQSDPGDVSWKSSKQSTVADSTTEAEYIAASEAAKEAVWIRKFITELGVIPSYSSPVDLYCDNNGAIAQAKEPRSHQKFKHIERRYHLIRDIVDKGDVKISRVSTDANDVDPLTKPLPRPKHESHTTAIGIRFLKQRSCF
ncbi:unnamed protein product [Microthlaspi erraticum]|uniref:Reverse transcriptase Ty1/copia-type domain-containing protein n=1 Tax=Microthlaspi erraticum TaxID=1685480 RepID=A0A6D2KK75_9BRAS|nr:unnamed protein product [Microthlaspi erraticum]